MTEQNEQNPAETPLMSTDLRNDPEALYQLLGAVVHRFALHSVTLSPKERQTEYALRVDEGDEQTFMLSSEVRPEWAEENSDK
jgi:hypothetical protein